MRLLPLLALLSITVPVGLVSAAGIIPCDGALGKVCNACELMALGQNILKFVITITVIGSAIVFAVAGLKMVTSAGNTSQVEEAKGMMTNVLIGIMITLAAWLIVDTVMKMPNFVDQGKFGMWNQIQCAPEPTYRTTDPVATGGGPAGTGGVAVVPSGGTCATGSRDCSVDKLQSYSQGGLFSSNPQLASAMSVVCMQESSGNTGIEAGTDRLWGSNDGFSYGLFQINLTSNTISCNGETLNCPSAFKIDPQYADCRGRATDPEKCWRTEKWGKANAALGFGKTIADRTLYDKCKAAAQNPACNIPKAQELYLQQGSRAWYTTFNKCGISI